MGFLKSLFSKGNRTAKVSTSKVKQPVDIDVSPDLVSGIAVIYQIPNPTGREREFLESQSQNLYRQLNPEFSAALDRVGFRKACLNGFVGSKEEAVELAMRPSLNVVVQFRSIMLPGMTSKPFDCYFITWLTKPTGGKPAVWITGDQKIMRE